MGLTKKVKGEIINKISVQYRYKLSVKWCMSKWIRWQLEINSYLIDYYYSEKILCSHYILIQMYCITALVKVWKIQAEDGKETETFHFNMVLFVRNWNLWTKHFHLDLVCFESMSTKYGIIYHFDESKCWFQPFRACFNSFEFLYRILFLHWKDKFNPTTDSSTKQGIA